MLEEHEFICPYCWENISMLLDLTGGSQQYVEDCEVCCNPISIYYEIDQDADSNQVSLANFSAEPAQAT